MIQIISKDLFSNRIFTLLVECLLSKPRLSDKKTPLNSLQKSFSKKKNHEGNALIIFRWYALHTFRTIKSFYEWSLYALLFFENTTTDFKTIRELTFELSCCMIGADVEDQLKEKNILSIHREHNTCNCKVK